MRVVHTWHLLSANAFHVKLSRLPTPCSVAFYLFEAVLFRFYVLCPGLCLSLPPSLHSKHTDDFISPHIYFPPFTISFAIYIFNSQFHLSHCNSLWDWICAAAFIVLCPQNHRNLRWKRLMRSSCPFPLPMLNCFLQSNFKITHSAGLSPLLLEDYSTVLGCVSHH